MKEMIRYGLILSLICIVASGLLAGVNSLTKSRIIAQASQEQQNSLKEVLPNADSFEPVKSGSKTVYYKAYDKNKNILGFAFNAQAKGYSSIIETLVGMRKDGTINAIKVLSLNETPGLGSRVAESNFTAQFAEKNILSLNNVVAITAATISSKAVIDSVKNKLKEIQNLIKNEP